MKLQPILDRLAQASTWGGIISLVTLCGVVISPEQTEAIIAAGVSIIAAISIFKNS